MKDKVDASEDLVSLGFLFYLKKIDYTEAKGIKEDGMFQYQKIRNAIIKKLGMRHKIRLKL